MYRSAQLVSNVKKEKETTNEKNETEEAAAAAAAAQKKKQNIRGKKRSPRLSKLANSNTTWKVSDDVQYTTKFQTYSLKFPSHLLRSAQRELKKCADNTAWQAKAVLASYAKREQYVRVACPPLANSEKFKRFEEDFPHLPTRDQKIAFGQIEEDMCYRARPMDRLVVGDVGFGKTEVAIRALVRMVLSWGSTRRRQGVLLAPTIILAGERAKRASLLEDENASPNTTMNNVYSFGSLGAAQHHRTLQTRLQNTGIELLLYHGSCKRATMKEQIEAISSGRCQIIVGTHALLSKVSVMRWSYGHLFHHNF